MEVVAEIAVIGGSGVYNIKDCPLMKEITVDTPFGKPSDNLLLVNVDGVRVLFLPRHGRGHVVNPSEINYRANIFALKKLGVKWIIGVSAVGSLQEEIVPGHVVLADQFIDRTSKRKSTFYEEGVVGHVPFGEPICSVLHGMLHEACKAQGVTFHPHGTYVCMEGPAFSTKAESQLYRSWNAQVIGMTALTEAKLAREAEISYGLLAMATDYDCWREGHDAVTVDQVVAVLTRNAAMAQDLVRAVVARVARHRGAAPSAHSAAAHAIMTSPAKIPPALLRELQPLLRKYLPAPPPPAPALPVWTPLGLFVAVTAVTLFFARRM